MFEVYKNYQDASPATFDNYYNALEHVKRLHNEGYHVMVNEIENGMTVCTHCFESFIDLEDGWDDFEYGIYDMDEEEYLSMIL